METVFTKLKYNKLAAVAFGIILFFMTHLFSFDSILFTDKFSYGYGFQVKSWKVAGFPFQDYGTFSGSLVPTAHCKEIKIHETFKKLLQNTKTVAPLALPELGRCDMSGITIIGMDVFIGKDIVEKEGLVFLFQLYLKNSIITNISTESPHSGFLKIKGKVVG